MLCIWWDWKGVLYYELLLENQTINSNKYCSQLDQQKAVLSKKVSRISQQKTHIHQDNARSRFSLTPRQKLLQLDWKVLIHLPYTPDNAPLDVHLFQSLQINGKTFNSLKDCIRHLEQLFAQKIKSFGKMEL